MTRYLKSPKINKMKIKPKCKDLNNRKMKFIPTEMIKTNSNKLKTKISKKNENNAHFSICNAGCGLQN